MCLNLTLFLSGGGGGGGRGFVVKVLTRNPSGSELQPHWNLCGFRGSGTLQSPSPVLLKPRKDMNDVSCRRDMTEILLKVVSVKQHSINQSALSFSPIHVHTSGFFSSCLRSSKNDFSK